MSTHVDLDALAASYIHRPAGAASLDHARRAVVDAQATAGEWAIDVGGGPGEHAAVWAQQGFRALVVDPTKAMVEQAASRPGVLAVRGKGEQLPLRPGSVPLVYFHLSIHYGDWRESLREASRVLRPGGEVCIWTLGPAHHATSLQGRYFPSVKKIDEGRFPDPDHLVDALVRLGLETRVDREIESKERAARGWEEAVRARFISTLQLIPDAELESGLARFAEQHPDPDEIVRYGLTWDHVRATKL